MDHSLYYNTVISIVLSPCGKYFLAGNAHGDLTLVSLNNLVPNAENGEYYPGQITKKSFSLASNHKAQIYSMTSSDQFLMIGFTGEIVGWRWQDILNTDSGLMPSSAWRVRVPISKDENHASEVNSLKFDKSSNDTGDVLYAGCGNRVHSFSLEDGQYLRAYSGHTKYVHNIDIKDNLVVSAGEDGSIRMCDKRTSNVVNIIEPYKSKGVARPDLGNWIGDVFLSEDWLVCGGGARLSLWNMRSTDCPMTVFASSVDNGIHVARIHQNEVLAGGSAEDFSIYGFNDELRTRIQSSNSIVFACAVQAEPNLPKALVTVGNSNNIDVSTNFRYREYTVPFY